MLSNEEIAQITSEVVGRVMDRALAEAESGEGRSTAEIINESLYQEHERLRKAGGGVEADRRFYAGIRHELPRASPARQNRLLQMIVERYADEIAGHFNPRVYRFATCVAPFALNALLNSLSPRRVLSRLRDLPSLDEHIIVQGETETYKRLSGQGAVIVAPTHSSNFDSLVMGWVQYHLGLGPLTYGAGLNLFSNPIIGRFMHNMGAYTVDRLKTDPLYKDVLKEYATLTLEYGQDNLFFPGGTRSRSGAVERHLKKGLLGTSVEAYRNNLLRKKTNPLIYVVPVTISYPLVLEASTLIDDYLKEAGKARYIIVDDEFSQWQRWLAFMRGLFALDLRIYVRFGRPLDPFGNDVDDEGRSRDPRGREIDPSGYLRLDAEIVKDEVRDAQYTSILADRIREAFERENVVVPTHVAAFAFFELLRRQSPRRDLYRFLRALGPEVSLSLPDVENEVQALVGELRERESRDRIHLSQSIAGADVSEIMRRALRSFGTYHTTPPLERRGVRLHVGDPNLLFYYRNRLDGYGLRGSTPLVRDRRPP